MKNAVHLITFTSPDGKEKVVAFISYFLDNLPGTSAIDPNLDWIGSEVSSDYPDIGRSQVGDFHYTPTGSRIYSSYTLKTPVTSAEYPLAYSLNYYVTYRHFYRFAFISDDPTIHEYNDLRTYIISSIKLNDIS